MNEILTIPNLIIIVTTIIIYLVVDNIFQKIIIKHNNITNTFLANTSKIIVILIGIFVFCSQYPVFEKSLNSLFTNSALIVAVLGFILQNTIKNIIAGLMLLSAETFKIGDRIRMPAQDITGTIEEMTLRHTTLKLVTNERAIIPNSIMNDSIIVNNDIKESITSYPISLQVKIDKDISLAKQILEEAIEANQNLLNKENSKVTISHVTETIVELKALIWTKDIETSFEELSNLYKDTKEKKINNYMKKLNNKEESTNKVKRKVTKSTKTANVVNAI